MLTQKQEKFVEELVKGKSQREAYKAAYNTSRMKDKSIDELASRLFRKVEIKSRYEELRKLTESKTADDAASMRAKIIALHNEIIDVDIFDYIENTEEGMQLKEEALRGSGKAIKTIWYDTRGNLRVEFYDKQISAQKLVELYGLVETETSSDAGITINVPAEYLK